MSVAVNQNQAPVEQPQQTPEQQPVVTPLPVQPQPQPTLDPAAIQTLKASSPTAESIFTTLAGRERDRGLTDLRRLKMLMVQAKRTVVDEDFMNAFQQLQAIGAGVIVFGRAGKSDQFKWNFSLKEIGNMAFGGAAATTPAPETVKKAVVRRPRKAKVKKVARVAKPKVGQPGRPVGYKMSRAEKARWYAARWGKKATKVKKTKARKVKAAPRKVAKVPVQMLSKNDMKQLAQLAKLLKALKG